MSFGLLNLFTRRTATTPQAAGLCVVAVKSKVIMGRDARPQTCTAQDEMRNKKAGFSSVNGKARYMVICTDNSD
ncbi:MULTISPECIES: hypothetical protein [unclassified Paludibacterium]|uniref:hypothetical protein n=1 Tax=unclassified Paludibacterium TaxID=2618429 RepID=UPI001C0521F9|nr:hypothetical protein [Paludibacterium sp. B53371]